MDQALDLVTWFSEPGDRILDLCAGSGTFGLACRILDREYVGYEVDPTWGAFAQRRIVSDLSERDQERFGRWTVTQEAERDDANRRKKNTSRVRKILEESKGT